MPSTPHSMTERVRKRSQTVGEGFLGKTKARARSRRPRCSHERNELPVGSPIIKAPTNV